MARRGTGAGLVLALLSLAVPGAARSATPRVVGGHEAAPGAYPFAVALLRADIAGVVGAQFCGGSLVAPAWVLTAAHCVASAPGLPLAAREIDVVIGQADLAGARTTRRRLLGIRVHPAFRLGRETASSDVALLRLRRPVALARVRLAAAGAAPAVGEPARVVGWGALDPSAGGPFPSTLREGGVAILADAACAARTAYGSGYDPATMLCAGLPEGGVDACAGDSGGPLVTGPREAPGSSASSPSARAAPTRRSPASTPASPPSAAGSTAWSRARSRAARASSRSSSAMAASSCARACARARGSGGSS